jgi:V-type H+-transporting ATPase subunit d
MNEDQEERLAYAEEQSFVYYTSSPGGLLSFNIENGYFESLLRGFRSAFLTELQYRQLCQCETLEDVKLTLGDSDYTGCFNQISKLTPDILVDRCSQKFVEEFDHVRQQAVGPLATFCDFITYEYMINNICFMISSLIKGGQPEQLLAKCDPVGKFPYMRSILTFENTEDGLIQLYSTFLIDTPVAKYFELYFQDAAQGSGENVLDHVSQIFREEQIDIINDMLKKLWLEDFYEYTQSLGGETAKVMKELLEYEADRRAIAIMINSFSTPLNEPSRRDDRQKLFASFGKLYPEGIAQFPNVGDTNSLGAVLENYSEYYELWDRAQREGLEIEDLLYEREVYLNRFGFDGQSHFACFWSFVKLKEQEKRNIFWITECINQKLKDSDMINRWIAIF